MNKEIVICGIPFGKEIEKDALKYAKDNGFTSVQIYVYWREFEPEEREQFLWDKYDRQVIAIKEAGLKFVPFILMGPKYAAPDWWLKDSKHKGLTCLEHRKESPIESIWNPDFRVEVERVLKAFSEHYLPWNVLESIQPGICGDYGEAIFPVVGNWPGDYHTHRGFWCGGEDATISFRNAMRVKYVTINRLNEHWRTNYIDFKQVIPFLRVYQPSRTAYLDLLLWYNQSMTDYSDFWMEQCRSYFPDIPVYLCTGGMEEPEHGSSFSQQAKIAAKHSGGIRLTNEGNNFYENFYLTVHMHSACVFYGSYLGLEPVGPILPQGVATRMYGSAAYGNRQVFHYYGNVVGKEKEIGAATYVKQYQDLITERKINHSITFFWALDEASLNGTEISDNIKASITTIRKKYEVNVADEEMILDGALEHSKILIMLDVKMVRTSVLQKIADWVHKGGVLLANCHPYDIEYRPVANFEAVFGMTEQSEEVWGHSEYKTIPAEWMDKFNQLDGDHSMIGWNKLEETVRPLLKNEEKYNNGVETKEAYCAFEHDYGKGKGKGIYFAAPLDLDAQADAIWTPSPAFQYLLDDCCKAFGGVNPMELSDMQIAKARIGEKELVLYQDGSIVLENNKHNHN